MSKPDVDKLDKMLDEQAPTVPFKVTVVQVENIVRTTEYEIFAENAEQAQKMYEAGGTGRAISNKVTEDRYAPQVTAVIPMEPPVMQ